MSGKQAINVQDDPMDDINAQLQKLQAAEDQQKADQALYQKRIAEASQKGGFELAITLLYVIMANLPPLDGSPDTTGATVEGHFNDKIEISGDGLSVMGALTKYINGLESKFNNKEGQPADLTAFAHDADTFLANSQEGSALDKAVPGSALSAIRTKIQAMRNDIRLTGETKPVGTYHLTDDQADLSASHSFGDLYKNAQQPGATPTGADPAKDDSLDARTAIQNFTNGFQLASSAADGANSSLKLQTDQQTKDATNFMSFLNTMGQSFFKPNDTMVGNQTR